MPGHHVRFEPARARVLDVELGCWVLRTFGYRAACSCGWRGTVRDTIAAARPDARAHRGGDPAPSI